MIAYREGTIGGLERRVTFILQGIFLMRLF